MTLIEVVVAIGILAILATAALGLYLASLGASKSHQNRELAITVAGQSMELVASWSIDHLVTGRTQGAVQSQWAATLNPATSASVVAGVGSSYPLWDSFANASSTPSLPLVSTSTFNGTEFTTQTFIGRCYQPTTAARATAGDCKRVGASQPSTTPAGTAPMLRVMVVVQWESDDSCTTSILTNPCKYEVSTLLEPSTADVEWVTSG